jgi:hypothetical protein
METKEKKTLSVRIPADLYDDWKAECENNGFTMSEGIRLLLEKDLKNEPPKILNYPVELPGGDVLLKESSSATNNPGKTGSMTKWMIDNKIPCPICRTWSSRQNYRRDHAAKHGYSSGYELIQANLQEVERMVTERQIEFNNDN